MPKITAIHIPDDKKGESGITEVKIDDGSKKSVPRVARDIDNGAENYYYTLKGKRANVIAVENSGDSGMHIRTKPDDQKGNNLLELERY